ncbi:MAG: hypothetical protein VX433_05935 [Candidatus Thermoplasmatota archaeon]|nr:hypothetical protein [Candidatus Thermoplasmatota archaeon]
MDMQEFFQDRRNQAMFGGSVLFMLIFPIYFSLVPSLVGLDDAGVSDASGTWSVSFTEESFTQTENTGELGDGESFDSIFLLTEDMIGANRNVASVTIEVSCTDNDDVGFNDGGSGDSDLVGVSGELQDQSGSGDCGGGNAFSMTWNIVDGYDGVTYEDEAKMSDITARWSDNESARGDWLVGITAEVSEAPFPASIANGDDGQDYDITWTAVVFEVSMEPVLNIDDPTTE